MNTQTRWDERDEICDRLLPTSFVSFLFQQLCALHSKYIKIRNMYYVYWNRTDAHWMFSCSLVRECNNFFRLKKQNKRKLHYSGYHFFLVTAFANFDNAVKLCYFPPVHVEFQTNDCNHRPLLVVDWRNAI